MDSVQNQTRMCLILPPKINSHGLWKGLAMGEDYDWYSYQLPRVEMTIILIFIVTQVCHQSLKHLGFSSFTSQLIAGVLLSPAVLGKTAANKLITDESTQGLGSLGTFGYVCYLFINGVKMDVGMVATVGRRAFYIGFLAVLPPIIFSVTMLELFSDSPEQKTKSLLLIPGYTMSLFPVITTLLSELKILNSELGRLAQSSVIVGDFFSVFMFLVCNMFIGSVQQTLHDLTIAVSFVAFCFLVLRPAIKFVIGRHPEGKPVDQAYITIIVLVFIISVALAKWFNRFRYVAPYILGMAIPHGQPVGSALVEKLESMVDHILLPVFVSTCGMRVEHLFTGFNNDLTIIKAFNVLIALLVKFGAALLTPLYNGMPLKDTFALALIMSNKGAIELIGFTFLNDHKVIDSELFAFMFYVILFTSGIVSVLVKRLYDPSRKYAGYHKRNLIDSKPNADLAIVACIHVPENVNATINLLDVACSNHNPLSVNVLHLVRLRGQAAPIFISHQKKRRVTSTSTYSENIIVSFNKFEGINWGAVSVNTFTSLSSPNFMHDDICTLALDKLASLIVLPFHRTWYIDGSIESDDEIIRGLNCRVLEKSPCSVGILVDRGNSRKPTLDPLSEPEFDVAIIFLGGPDDREALTFAKRMALNTRVRLTVVHLAAAENNEFEDWGTVLDTMILRDVKSNGYVNYVEKEVNGGPETAVILRSMVNEFDLIVVGRRDNIDAPQTSGLKEWSEFPELGVLGDLLASPDFNGRSSIFAVQQQTNL